jgi:hypothetical protein
MRRLILPFLILMVILVACSTTAPAKEQTTSQPSPVSNATPSPADDPALLPTLFPNATGSSELTRTDEQGAVVVQVVPLNLGTPADTLEFDVVMNTHSVDLSMDLASLATLSTDAGVTVQPTLWDAPLGGHHVEGKLIFPAVKDGKSILEGASKLTLTVINVDVASRVFEWELK